LSTSCSTCPLGSNRDLSLAPYCLSCILQKSAESLLSTGSKKIKFHQYADDCQIYVDTSVSEVHSAIDQLSSCLHEVDVWMSSSRLRLNASKTRVLWLGSRHNIDRLTVHEVPVLSSTVGVVGSARDLGVVTDSRLSMVDHVASVCRSPYYHIAVFVTRRCKDISPCVHLQSPGLLQLSFVRRHRQLASTTAVCTKCCRQVNDADGSP